MNLTVFSSETLPLLPGGNRASRPKISFSKGGLISLNYSASLQLGLKSGDKLSLAQDEDGQWFIFNDPTGFIIRTHSDRKAHCFNHVSLKNLFYESAGLDQTTSARFLIAGQPTVFGKVKYWGILVG